MRRPRLIVASCLVVLATAPVMGQATKSAPSPPPLPPVQRPASNEASPPDTTLPSYEPQLDRLAELMGALAFLRDLCGKGDGSDWRAQMTALIDAEATTPIRKERLAGAYNRGFRGYEATYRACTPSAELVIRRFLDEGDRLAKDLATRFGSG